MHAVRQKLISMKIKCRFVQSNWIYKLKTQNLQKAFAKSIWGDKYIGHTDKKNAE